MPAQYEAIKEKLLKQGMDRQEAEKHAAMIYNSTHPKNPVTKNSK